MPERLVSHCLLVEGAHGPLWTEHGAGGEAWFGFTAVRAVGDDVLLVPLRGHTRGHCAVAVRRPAAPQRPTA